VNDLVVDKDLKSESAEGPQASTVMPLGKHHLPSPEVVPG
jgi:hypothetical protein